MELDYYELTSILKADDLPRDIKISYVATLDDYLLVGTWNGKVLKYSLEMEMGKKDAKAQLQSQIVIQHNKSIDKISILKKQNRILILCDNILRFYDLNLKPLTQIRNIKNVEHYAFYLAKENTSNLGFLAISRRRTINIYLLAQEINFIKEINWLEPIINLAIDSSTLCIADHYNYYMLSLYDDSSKKLFQVQQIRTPMLKVIDDDEFLVALTVDNSNVLGMILNSKGDAVRPNIQWSKYPKKIALEYPFIISYFDNQILIHDLMSSKLIQNIPLRERYSSIIDNMLLESTIPYLQRLLHFDKDQQAGSNLISIFLIKEKEIISLSYIDLILQIQPFIQQQQYEIILNKLESVQSTLCEQSIHFNKLKIEIAYCYNLIGIKKLIKMEFDSCNTHFIKGKLDARFLCLLFKRFRKWKKLNLLACCRKFDLNIHPGIIDALDNVEDVEAIVKQNSENEMNFKTLIKKYDDFLLNYLQLYKNKYLKDKSKDQGQIELINTTMVKLLAEYKNYDQLYNLLELPLVCDFEACLAYIQQLKLPYAESLIYKQLNEFNMVYQLWINIYDDEDIKQNELNLKLKFNDMDMFYKNLKYIKDQHYFNKVILWLLDKDTLNAMENLILLDKPIFSQINTDKVIKLLKSKNDLNSVKSLNRFLYTLIFANGERKIEYCYEMFKSYINLIDSEKVNKRMEQLDHAFIVAKSIRPKLTFLNFLKNKKDKFSKLRNELISLLFLINWYDKMNDILNMVKQLDLLFELACVHSILGQHHLTLKYLIQFQDHNMAMEYCFNGGKIFRHTIDPNIQNQLFNELLNIYLNLDDEYTSLAQVQILLSSYRSFFDVVKVLNLLPNHWPAQIITQFLLFKGREVLKLKNQAKIQVGLTISNNIQLNQEYLNNKQNRVIFNKGQTCKLCGLEIQLDDPLCLNELQLVHKDCIDKR